MQRLHVSKQQKHSALRLHDRIVYALLVSIGLVSTIIFGMWWFQLNHIPQNFSGTLHFIDFLLFFILSYVVWFPIMSELFFWYIIHFMKHPKYLRPESYKRVAFLTAFVPGKEPYDVLEKTLKAMASVDYPHDTWLLDEGNDAQAKRICQLYGVKHFSRKGIAKYNMSTGAFKAKTKAGNYNSWYDRHKNKYDFVGQIDVDFTPRKDFLMKTLGYFRDPEIGFVGSPQVYGNTSDSWIAQGAAEQAYNFHGPMQKGFYGHDMSLFIGANHVVRVAAHDAIDGYSGHIVEDHITGMKFYVKRWKSVYVPEILALGEGPSTWDAYFSQQMRWSYGLFDILFTHSPKLFKQMHLKHVFNYFNLQQFYFTGLIQMVGVILLTLYFVFGIQATAMKLYELLLIYPTVILMQQIIFLWSQKFNIDPKNESGLMIRAKLLSLAAWPIYLLALIGIVTRKRLTYAVTPKGDKQYEPAKVSLFLPHFIIGSITAFDILISFYTHHQSLQLIFWAWMNSIFMYYFFLNEALKKVTQIAQDIRTSMNFSPRLRKLSIVG